VGGGLDPIDLSKKSAVFVLHLNYVRRPGQQSLTIIPISWRAACAFIALHHRHHKPPRGQKFAIAVVDERGVMRGVATCGRPIARALDDGLTLEVNRTCVDGCPNANSALYGACARIARAMGYRRIHTDTQAEESGASLRAAGWERLGERGGRRNWANSSQKLRHLRDDGAAEGVARIRWGKVL